MNCLTVKIYIDNSVLSLHNYCIHERSDMSRNKIYTSRIELCVTKKQKDKVKKAAKRNQITVNQIIRDMIDDYDQ